ncbi:unnamed protein product, partial [Trichogramma brassicae]
VETASTYAIERINRSLGSASIALDAKTRSTLLIHFISYRVKPCVHLIRTRTRANQVHQQIRALRHRSRSSDREPQHDLCPIGQNSWCQWQKVKANRTLKTFKHTNSPPPAVMDAIKSIYTDLSKVELLQTCVGQFTQNPNESFNQTLWNSGEYADMVLCYGAANEIGAIVARLYREKFGPREDQPNRPKRRMPDRRTIIGAVRRLRETGSVTVKNPNGGRPQRERLIHQEAVLQAFEDDPQTSLSIVANQLNTSYSNCQRIMKDAGQHDFKKQNNVKQRKKNPVDREVRLHPYARRLRSAVQNCVTIWSIIVNLSIIDSYLAILCSRALTCCCSSSTRSFVSSIHPRTLFKQSNKWSYILRTLPLLNRAKSRTDSLTRAATRSGSLVSTSGVVQSSALMRSFREQKLKKNQHGDSDLDRAGARRPHQRELARSPIAPTPCRPRRRRSSRAYTATGPLYNGHTCSRQPNSPAADSRTSAAEEKPIILKIEELSELFETVIQTSPRNNLLEQFNRDNNNPENHTNNRGIQNNNGTGRLINQVETNAENMATHRGPSFKDIVQLVPSFSGRDKEEAIKFVKGCRLAEELLKQNQKADFLKFIEVKLSGIALECISSTALASITALTEFVKKNFGTHKLFFECYGDLSKIKQGNKEGVSTFYARLKDLEREIKAAARRDGKHDAAFKASLRVDLLTAFKRGLRCTKMLVYVNMSFMWKLIQHTIMYDTSRSALALALASMAVRAVANTLLIYSALAFFATHENSYSLSFEFNNRYLSSSRLLRGHTLLASPPELDIFFRTRCLVPSCECGSRFCRRWQVPNLLCRLHLMCTTNCPSTQYSCNELTNYDISWTIVTAIITQRQIKTQPGRVPNEQIEPPHQEDGSENHPEVGVVEEHQVLPGPAALARRRDKRTMALISTPDHHQLDVVRSRLSKLARPLAECTKRELLMLLTETHRATLRLCTAERLIKEKNAGTAVEHAHTHARETIAISYVLVDAIILNRSILHCCARVAPRMTLAELLFLILCHMMIILYALAQMVCAERTNVKFWNINIQRSFVNFFRFWTIDKAAYYIIASSPAYYQLPPQSPTLLFATVTLPSDASKTSCYTIVRKLTRVRRSGMCRPIYPYLGRSSRSFGHAISFRVTRRSNSCDKGIHIISILMEEIPHAIGGVKKERARATTTGDGKMLTFNTGGLAEDHQTYDPNREAFAALSTVLAELPDRANVNQMIQRELLSSPTISTASELRVCVIGVLVHPRVSSVSACGTRGAPRPLHTLHPYYGSGPSPLRPRPADVTRGEQPTYVTPATRWSTRVVVDLVCEALREYLAVIFNVPRQSSSGNAARVRAQCECECVSLGSECVMSLESRAQ